MEEENRGQGRTEDKEYEIPIEGEEDLEGEIPVTEEVEEDPVREAEEAVDPETGSEAGQGPCRGETGETEDPGEAEDCEDPENAEASQDEADPGSDEKTRKEESPEGKKKPSFFGRKKKETDKYQTQIDDLTDRLKRNLAEFDNFRKRTEKEKASMYVIGARDIVEKVLPVVDSFERGLAQAQEGDAFADGMKMIYRQLMTALEEAGVKPIEAVGKEFNPDFHNAVMHVDDESLGENVVAEELQKGYTYKDFVVRHSMVKVAN